MLAIIAAIVTAIGIVWYWLPTVAICLAGLGLAFAFCYLALPDIFGAITKTVKAVMS